MEKQPAGHDYPVVDAHFHIWDLKKFDYPWPNSDVPSLNRNVTIDEYKGAISTSPVTHGVFVQVLNGHDDETKWVINVASTNPFVKGIVGGVDISKPETSSTLDTLGTSELFVGVRHLIDFEPAGWLLTREVDSGIVQLQKRQLTLDLPLRPHQIKEAETVVRAHPSVKFVINHLAKPWSDDWKEYDLWKKSLTELTTYPNVHCKISGLLSEVGKWKTDDFRSAITHALGVFGYERCLFVSDWPVSTKGGASYNQTWKLTTDLLDHLNDHEKGMIFGQNAINFYNLDVDPLV